MSYKTCITAHPIYVFHTSKQNKRFHDIHKFRVNSSYFADPMTKLITTSGISFIAGILATKPPKNFKSNDIGINHTIQIFFPLRCGFLSRVIGPLLYYTMDYMIGIYAAYISVIMLWMYVRMKVDSSFLS